MDGMLCEISTSSLSGIPGMSGQFLRGSLAVELRGRMSHTLQKGWWNEQRSGSKWKLHQRFNNL